jgi:peptidyl-prolyl cis-trans isomerase SurA|tara:strand:+ start:316 stop:1503 length:1188 start_codon:yes stop_codon:yes gene_type:complete
MKFKPVVPIFIVMIVFANLSNAKDTFAPMIQVDDMIITQYEINQRALFFELLKFPGNHKKEAKKTLIDDRLKFKAARQFDVEANPAALNFELEMFAKRANLSVDQFAKRLKKAGVDRITWENYMQIPILWFETVNRKFASKISSSMSNRNVENQSTSGSEIQVLLTEIIIPVQLGFEEEARQKIEDLRKIRSLEKFSEAAFSSSVAPTREVGGKVKWQNLSKLPSVVRPLIAGLSIGEVSEPLPISGGLAIFQLRDLRESNKKLRSKFVDYAEFTFKKNKKTNNLIISNVMICDDLYSFLNNTKEAKLKRNNVIESSLSKKLKNTLSELDKNEFIFHGNDDSITEVIMVCGRSEKENLSTGDISKISRINANKRLLSLANSYLDNLRQEARIVFK